MLALYLALQVQAASAPGPVARVAITPNPAVVRAGDTLRLTAQALDARGRPVAGASVRWFRSAGRFEGRVDSTGLVTAGAVGTLVIRAVATLPGSPPSAPATVSVRMVPGVATRLDVAPDANRMITGQRLRFTAAAYSQRGDRRDDVIRWSTDEPTVLRVTRDGLVEARRAGTATLRATNDTLMRSWQITVEPDNIRRLEISGAPAEARTGDVIRPRRTARDAAGRELFGLAPAWSIAPGGATIDQDGAFVAAQPGEYFIQARLGGQTAEAVVKIRPRDVRRPTTTVGRLPLPVVGGEFWPHPNGRNAYYTTTSDRAYALDIGDPANVRITDSILVDARTINDFMTTADGRWGVMTREGASSRRNGIVIVDLADPAHPRPVADYTETVTGGVHSTFVYTQPNHGTHVYLTDDATGSMRVIDINTPTQPREIARWQPRAELAGNYVHDLEVKDGLAYLAYWNDGLVILDVGNGMRGGSPSNPQLVAQHKYDLDDIYRNVAASGGAGFVRGTHTAWRDTRRPYVYIADEVFSTRPQGIVMPNRTELGKANGRLHVVDISDLSRPRTVAWFEPQDGGVHNFWVQGDTIYIGDYQGGLRVLDISGELRGDLLAQGREMAHVHTGDARGVVPNAAMAWGAFYHNGLVWVNDMFSGLWAVRVEPRIDPRRTEPTVP